MGQKGIEVSERKSTGPLKPKRILKPIRELLAKRIKKAARELKPVKRKELH